MTRGVEVDTSEEKQVTLTGVMEELGFKFEGKEQWIKSLQISNNLLEKYFYCNGLE